MPAHRPTAEPIIVWLALGLALVPVLARAVTNATAQAYFDLDPAVIESPLAALTPAVSMALDLVSLAGSAVVLGGASGAGRGRLWLWASGCAAPACALLAYHAAWGGAHGVGSYEQARVGLAWASGIALCAALSGLAPDAPQRRACLAVLLGVIGLLAVRAAVQVAVEAPATAAAFRAQREVLLAAQGWAPDSPQAKSYQRRVLQTEATAWFGLANVLGSVGAGVAAAGLAALAGTAWRPGGAAPSRWALPAAWAAPGALVVWLTGSRGAWVALGSGAVLAVAAGWVVRRSGPSQGRARPLARWIVWLPVGLVLAGQGLIGARGLLDDALGELSVWFRAMYASAAAAIGADAWLTGVGPGGFRDAYLLAKDPRSPEEVSSPHSLPWDFWATLGVPGLALVAAWLAWQCRGWAAVARRGAHDDDDDPAPARAAARFVALVPAAAVLASAWTERADPQPEAAIARLIGLGLWIALAWHAQRPGAPSTRTLRAAGLAAVAVWALHGQIEVVWTWPASAGVLWAVLGASSATSRLPTGPATAAGQRKRARRLAGWACAAVVIGAGVAAAPAAARAWRAEARAAQAARALWPIARAGTLLRRLSDPLEPAPKGQIIAELALVVGLDPSGLPPGAAGLDAVRAAALAAEVAGLSAAAEFLVPHGAQSGVTRADWRLWRERARVLARLAGAQAALGQPERARLAAGLAIEALPLPPEGARDAAVRASMRATIAVTLEGLGERGGLTAADSAALRASAAEALERAAALDPTNPLHLDTLLRLLQRAPAPAPDAQPAGGDAPAARIAGVARRLLALDDLAGLDRAVRGLSQGRRREVERLAVLGPRPE
ncbi:MAG: hypothetical protein C0468_01915 [Planctomyces sp.]|nr:hypothetical protein [Planctomyces sp.]